MRLFYILLLAGSLQAGPTATPTPAPKAADPAVVKVDDVVILKSDTSRSKAGDAGKIIKIGLAKGTTIYYVCVPGKDAVIEVRQTDVASVLLVP